MTIWRVRILFWRAQLCRLETCITDAALFDRCPVIVIHSDVVVILILSVVSRLAQPSWLLIFNQKGIVFQILL